MYLSLNDADEFWDDAMRRRTLELPAGVACAEPVAVQGEREGDPIWAILLLAVGVVLFGGSLIYFAAVVVR